MYVFTDSEGWVIDLAVADGEIPEITAMGGVYLDDERFVDVYQNPRSYKIINSQPVRQDTERPPEPPPEPTDIELLRLEQAQSNAEMIDLMMAMLGGM